MMESFFSIYLWELFVYFSRLIWIVFHFDIYWGFFVLNWYNFIKVSNQIVCSSKLENSDFEFLGKATIFDQKSNDIFLHDFRVSYFGENWLKAY